MMLRHFSVRRPVNIYAAPSSQWYQIGAERGRPLGVNRADDGYQGLAEKFVNVGLG